VTAARIERFGPATRGARPVRAEQAQLAGARVGDFSGLPVQDEQGQGVRL
jgi:hypothetical protein